MPVRERSAELRRDAAMSPWGGETKRYWIPRQAPRPQRLAHERSGQGAAAFARDARAAWSCAGARHVRVATDAWRKRTTRTLAGACSGKRSALLGAGPRRSAPCTWAQVGSSPHAGRLVLAGTAEGNRFTEDGLPVRPATPGPKYPWRTGRGPAIRAEDRSNLDDHPPDQQGKANRLALDPVARPCRWQYVDLLVCRRGPLQRGRPGGSRAGLLPRAAAAPREPLPRCREAADRAEQADPRVLLQRCGNSSRTGSRGPGSRPSCGLGVRSSASGGPSSARRADDRRSPTTAQGQLSTTIRGSVQVPVLMGRL